MDLRLDGKVAVIAAATKGLGRACAFEYAKAGANVAICGRSAGPLKMTASDIERLTGVRVLPVVADVSKSEDVIQFVNAAVDTFGRMDALVCNAGGPPSGAFLSLSDEQWYDAVELNLMSVVRLIRQSVPYLRESGAGRIVNISSSSIKQPLPNLVLSNTIRLGLQGLMKTLSDELANDSILVNTVAPGRIDTDRVRSLDNAMAAKLKVSANDVKERSEAAIALGRYGDPEEFARYVVFLGSPLNTYVTGQTLLVDGGLTRGL